MEKFDQYLDGKLVYTLTKRDKREAEAFNKQALEHLLELTRKNNE
jgi:hypothetical protein